MNFHQKVLLQKALISKMAHKAAPTLPRLRMREELLKVRFLSQNCCDLEVARLVRHLCPSSLVFDSVVASYRLRQS